MTHSLDPVLDPGAKFIRKIESWSSDQTANPVEVISQRVASRDSDASIIVPTHQIREHKQSRELQEAMGNGDPTDKLESFRRQTSDQRLSVAVWRDLRGHGVTFLPSTVPRLGTIRHRFATTPIPLQASSLVKWWGGEGSNLRPTDYESAALTD